MKSTKPIYNEFTQIEIRDRRRRKIENRISLGVIAFVLFISILAFRSLFLFTDTYIMDHNGNILFTYPWPKDRNEFYLVPGLATPAPTPYPINREPYRQTSPSWTGLGAIQP